MRRPACIVNLIGGEESILSSRDVGCTTCVDTNKLFLISFELVLIIHSELVVVHIDLVVLLPDNSMTIVGGVTLTGHIASKLLNLYGESTLHLLNDIALAEKIVFRTACQSHQG